MGVLPSGVVVIDFLATLPHYRDHIAPVHDALPPNLRGRWYGPDDDVPPGGLAVVASYHDVRRARAAGRRIARMEHGAGQSYGGDPRTAFHPAYPGGSDHGDVELFLVPGPHPAARWRARHPSATVVEIGNPKSLPRLVPGPEPVVALSFHFNAHIGCEEANGTWRHYRDVLPSLRGFRVIGHSHPRHAERMRPWFEQAGIRYVERFEDVCREASVYVCDNSSTLFEFAATGRGVAVLNAPWYRPATEHGLRYWDAAGVGVNVWRPADLAGAIALALEDRPAQRRARAAALRLVYSHRTGGARRAADALMEWAA